VKSHLVMYAIPSSSNSLSIWKQATNCQEYIRLSIDPWFQIYRELQDDGTPVKTNMSPENQWLEDVFPTEIVTF